MSDRPLIAVDCDGVLYCWDRTVRYMLREKYKKDGRPYPPELDDPATSWNAVEEAVSPDMWEWVWTEGVEQGLFRHGDVMSGAIFGVQALHEFADLMIVTSRPEQGVYDTMSWLVHHLRQTVPLVGIHILSHGQPKSSVTPTPDLLIDDGPHNVADWILNTDSSVLLFDQPWNRDSTPSMWRRALRAYGWKDAVGKAKTLLTERREWGDIHREVI